MAGRAWTSLVACAAAAWLVLTPSTAQSANSSSDIVVTAVRSHLSNWRQAETSHVIMLSNGSQAELVRLSRNLERLHWLLSGLMGRGAVDDDIVKIRITLIGDAAQFDEMDLHNTRWQQGPFNDLFRIGRYYDPRDDGAVMASIGADQRVVIEHTNVNAHTVGDVLQSMVDHGSIRGGITPLKENTEMLRDEMAGAIGNMEDHAEQAMKDRDGMGITFGEKAIIMTEESMLYAGYAQHYLLTYFPAAYPRWYLDGFGQIFASLVVKGDNSLEFGRTPDGTTAVMHSFGPYPIKDVLDDAYLTQDPHKTGWTPIHAWMLAHFLFFSDKYRPLLRQYLALRAQGVGAETAAKVLGDQRELAHALGAYFLNRKPYIQVIYDGSKIEEPLVNRLRESEAAFIKGRLELGARVEIPPAADASTPPDRAADITRRRAVALRQRDVWLARLRNDAAHWSGELGAQLLLAEAECRSLHPAECLAAANRAQAIAPSGTQAMVWKGLAMVEQAAAMPPADRATMIASARELIIRANQMDHNAIGPLMAYYQSYAQTGETPTAAAIDGVQKAMEEVPAAPSTRLILASALAKRGEYEIARPVIMPVAMGPYDTPETPAAKALLAQIDSAAHDQNKSLATPHVPDQVGDTQSPTGAARQP